MSKTNSIAIVRLTALIVGARADLLRKGYIYTYIYNKTRAHLNHRAIPEYRYQANDQCEIIFPRLSSRFRFYVGINRGKTWYVAFMLTCG